MIVFFFISTLVVGLSHLYIGMRLIPLFFVVPMAKVAAWLVLMLCSTFLPLGFFIKYTSPDKYIPAWMYQGMYIQFGFFSMLFFFLLFRDASHFILKGFEYFTPSHTFLVERRDFLHQLSGGLIALSALGLTTWGALRIHRPPVLKNIKLPRAPEGIQTPNGWKIAQFSDLHISPGLPSAYIESVVTTINHANPDIVVFTGDLVDGGVAELKQKVDLLKKIKAPIYWVTGNHEYYSGAADWIMYLDSIGFHYLHNQGVLLNKNGVPLYLAGVPDLHGFQMIPSHDSNPSKALEAAEATHYKICMAHQPRSAKDVANAGAHLQLSGHTHNGQYFPFNLMIRLAQPFGQGLHQHKNTLVYVNPGTGYWGPPNRIGVPAEVTLFEWDA